MEEMCVFEESLDIDFDYEFDDVAKFYDFLRVETIHDILESERWFSFALGHPPSPLLLELESAADELGESDSTSCARSVTSDGGEYNVSSLNQWKKGLGLVKSKSATQLRLSNNSRLLQPTASQLAKQNQQIGVRVTKAPSRIQKFGSLLTSLGDIAATKRQKLENGYLRKVGQLKQQTCFSYKLPRQVGSSNVNSCHARPKTAAPKVSCPEPASRTQRHKSKNAAELSRDLPKANVPKESCLETTSRAQRHKPKNAAELSSDSKHDNCPVRARPLNRKTLEPKKTTPSLSPEIKVSKKNVPCSMKENRHPNTVASKPTTCYLKQNQIGRGRVTIMGC